MLVAALLLGMMHPAIQGPDIVVIPVPTATTLGAFGSVWSTELWAYNTGPHMIRVTPGPCRLTGSDSCSIELLPGIAVAIEDPIEPHHPYLTLSTPGPDDHLPGFDPVHFSLRVRDLSRAAESAGTEIPVVRDEDFVSETIHLLNVPVEADFRVMLRVFLHPFERHSQRFGIRVFAMDAPAFPLSEREIFLDPPASLPSVYTGASMAIAMIPDLLSGLPAEVSRVRVEIEPRTNPPGPYWAFLTVTHNETQQVTTVTPQ